MSDYIIYNIDLTVMPRRSYGYLFEPDKPVEKFPNYYLGKVLGTTGTELRLFRSRRSGKEEPVPNCVLRNENGIALIRIHNRQDVTITDLPKDQKNPKDKAKDCSVDNHASYPFAYVVVDYRDDMCQMAIEKSSSWDSKTDTIRYCLEQYFNDSFYYVLGIETKLMEKRVYKNFAKFIDQRTMDGGDVIESITFEYPNTRRKPTARIPRGLTRQIEHDTKELEIYGAISGMKTMKFDGEAQKKKLKQLSKIVVMNLDNTFELKVKFRDFGEYSCNDGAPAKFSMNDNVIGNYKGSKTPDVVNADSDLEAWLDDVHKQISIGKNGKAIPTKPRR